MLDVYKRQVSDGENPAGGPVQTRDAHRGASCTRLQDDRAEAENEEGGSGFAHRLQSCLLYTSEEFTRSVELFNRNFSCDLRGDCFLNVNPERRGGPYRIDEDVRKAVEKYRAADVDLYRRAKEIFSRMASRAGL